MSCGRHCSTCGYLFDVAHNQLCAEVKGLREQVAELRSVVSAEWHAQRVRFDAARGEKSTFCKPEGE